MKSIVIIALFALAQLSQSLSVISSMSLSSDGVKGSNASFQCSWTAAPGEIISYIRIRFNGTASGLKNFYIITPPTITNLPDIHDRLSVASNTSTSITIVIRNLICPDEGTYLCDVFYLAPGAADSTTKSSSSDFILKVPPKAPIVTLSDVQNGVLEGSLVNASCGANLGRPNKGRIQWKFYSGGLEFQPSTNDLQVATSNVPLQASDDNCTQRVESRLSLKTNKANQNMSLLCFVSNTDFPSNIQSGCTGDTLCAQTAAVSILYRVTDLTVNSVPQSMNYEGSTTTLTCYADGNPKPSYTWTKEDDVNRTLTGIQDGDSSTLILTNLRLDQDDGTYNCTASNVVLGVSYSITSWVNVNVVATTTTKATTKTSTTARTSTSVTTAPGASSESQSADNSQTNTIIIAVCVSVGCVIIIVLIIVGVVCWRKRQPKKTIEEPPEKPYNNHTNLSFQHAQPDLVSDEKKFNNPSLNSSFDQKHEDGLLYADLTYDNRPRSRKPMAITETSSDYSSDIQMPQV